VLKGSKKWLFPINEPAAYQVIPFINNGTLTRGYTFYRSMKDNIQFIICSVNGGQGTGVFVSDFCETNKATMIENINSKITSAHEFLKQTNHLIISYGSSYFYELVNSKKIVNNCHQFPNNYFTKQIGNSNLFKDSFFLIYFLLSHLRSWPKKKKGGD
jgi:hypothetical protein